MIVMHAHRPNALSILTPKFISTIVEQL
jgi:hypothetical protein